MTMTKGFMLLVSLFVAAYADKTHQSDLLLVAALAAFMAA